MAWHQRYLCILEGLDERRKQGSQQYGHNPGDGDGKTAHSTFDFAEFHRFCSSDRVRRGAKGEAFCDRVCDTENLADEFAENIAKHSGDNDYCDRNRDITAKFFGNAHSDRGSDRFWQKCYIFFV